MGHYRSSTKRRSAIESTRRKRKKYPDLAREVIRISDIVLEILDARFIEETRIKEMEELVKKLGKKLVYVVNKIDLTDESGIKEFMESKELLPFVLISCKNRKGISSLRSKIKIEADKIRNFSRKQTGIIGYPNTGKSSLINLLSGKSSAKTSSVSGFTKGIQKIRLTKEIMLLDTPGIIPLKEKGNVYSLISSKHAKIGVDRYDKVKEPESIAYGLMKKYPGKIEKYYQIEAEGDLNTLIEKLGRKKGFLKKGNEIDEDRTARLILKDWQENKIKMN